jgi:ribosomal protein S12 methylthiotransferase
MPGTAYVKIAEGCRNRCTFCAIPLIRGDLRSRVRSEIVAEVQELLSRGIREIVLIAQDLNAFGMDRGASELKVLLEELLMLPGKHWIRPLYVYPDTFDLNILPLFQQDPRLLAYFDIPFQHGAREILQKMARVGDAQSYLQLIMTIRQALPLSAIRTSILVGFPGETVSHLQELLDFQSKAALEWLGVFAYSAEEGTLAAGFKAKVPQKDARQRQAQVEGLQIDITAKRLDRFVGLETDVLIEEWVDGEELALGRTFFQAPEVDGLTVVHGPKSRLPIGEFIKVRLVRRNGVDMEAIPL